MDIRDRHTRILITCLVFIGVGALFTVLVKSGFQQQRRTQEQRDYLARLVQQLDAQKQALEKEREGLQNDPVFVEREVRRLLGYIREGEKPVKRPEGPSAVKPPPEPGPSPQAPRNVAAKVRQWVGMGQMAVAVILVILVALVAGIGFGGRWKSSVPESPKDEQKKP